MSHCPKCVGKAIYDPPQTVYQDYYHPQEVEVIRQIEIVRRHHCVPVYHHVTTVSVRDEYSGDFADGNPGLRTASLRRKRK